MCQESLINYLETVLNSGEKCVERSDIETFVYLGEQISHYEAVDAESPIKMPKAIQRHARALDEALASITVCDPAVGSGAFPVGMMTEIVRARLALTPYFNDVHERTPYQFKRHAIQSSIFGVDIDRGAVEIAKLRLWLSLVVDEANVQHIKPLPNLDYKIMAGDSLLTFPFTPRGLAEIENLKSEYSSDGLRTVYDSATPPDILLRAIALVRDPKATNSDARVEGQAKKLRMLGSLDRNHTFRYDPGFNQMASLRAVAQQLPASDERKAILWAAAAPGFNAMQPDYDVAVEQLNAARVSVYPIVIFHGDSGPAIANG